MGDTQVNEDPPEQTSKQQELVALQLLRLIAAVEGISLAPANIERTAPGERNWILNTYAECLLAVKDPQTRLRKTR